MRHQKLHASPAAPALCRRLEVLSADPVPQDSTLELKARQTNPNDLLYIIYYMILSKVELFCQWFWYSKA